VRKAIRSDEPPRYERKVKPASKLDPHREQIARLLRDVDGITNTRIRELIAEAGYRGGKTILDDYLRELRPIVSPTRGPRPARAAAPSLGAGQAQGLAQVPRSRADRPARDPAAPRRDARAGRPALPRRARAAPRVGDLRACCR
jgi:hypothetical protein